MDSIETQVTKDILSELLEDKIRNLLNKQSDNSAEIVNLSQAWMNLQKLDYSPSPTIAYTHTSSLDPTRGKVYGGNVEPTPIANSKVTASSTSITNW